ncbi:MAG: PQQ-dependent sugar dehydrogenase [Planctomycetes bacterium]|nr:PQQ-dependent sugar dehydrogenase [Planctomycetota bacterium]
MMRITALAFLLACCSVLSAQSVAGGFTADTLVDPVVGGRAMAFTPDGRLFYTENATGNIMVVNNPTGSPGAPVLFATLSDLVAPSGNDLGLHGIAIHPNFPSSGTSNTNRYIYVCYSTGTSGAPNLEVKRFQEDGSNPGTPLSPTPSLIVPAISMGSTGNNFGGRIAFGPDGRLYVTVGDGGASISLAGGFAQDTADRRGKVLRYADDGSIPLNNPLTGNAMWARGLHNPRGLAFNTSTSEPFNADVGNAATSGADELNVITVAGNYGWDTGGLSGARMVTGFEDPAWVLGASFEPSGVAFYPATGTAFPAVGYRGGVVYLASEAAAGAVVRVVLTGGNERTGVAAWTLANAFTAPVRDIQFGPDGNLYVLTDVVLYRIRYTGNTSNNPVANAGLDQTVNEGALVTLDGSGSSDPDVSDVLRYTWRQVGGSTVVTISNPTTVNPTFTAPQVTFNQSFTFELIIEDGNGGVSSDLVVIDVNNVSNDNDTGPTGFSPPGEGGCTTGDAAGWWMIVGALVTMLLAVRQWFARTRLD